MGALDSRTFGSLGQAPMRGRVKVSAVPVDIAAQITAAKLMTSWPSTHRCRPGQRKSTSFFPHLSSWGPKAFQMLTKHAAASDVRRRLQSAFLGAAAQRVPSAAQDGQPGGAREVNLLHSGLPGLLQLLQDACRAC